MSSLERFKIEDAGSYNSLADEFDQFSEIREPILQTLFTQARLTSCRRLLDVGTGTGLVAIEAARRFGTADLIAGIDLSDGLLQSAKRKVLGNDKVQFVKMDAETLAIETASFDALLSLYALLHFPNPQRALEEMFRVLRAGGRATVAVGSAPPWLSSVGVRHRISRLPDLLKIAQGRLLIAPRFLDGLLKKMPQPLSDAYEETELARHSNVRGARVVALMRAAGFTGVRWHWSGYQYSFEDPERFWLVQRVYSSFARKRLSGLSEQERAEVKRVFLDRCQRVLARGGSLVYPYAALFVSGRKQS